MASRDLALLTGRSPMQLRFKRNRDVVGREDVIGGFAFWRGVATPGYIRDQVNILYADTLALLTTMSEELKAKGLGGDNKSPLNLFYFGQMVPFMRAVSEFHGQHQAFSSNLWGSTLDTVNEYRERLVALHQAAKLLGYELSNAPQPKGATTFGDLTFDRAADRALGMGSAVWDLLKTVVYVVLVGALTIGLIYIIRR